jgi:flagellar hook assembly protein FlgD
MSQSPLEFNVATSEVVTYTSIVPFTLTQTISLKNEAGQVVHTLVPATQRNAGTYNDTWNGRNSQNQLIGDGPYFYIGDVTSGTYSMTWDVTNEFLDPNGCYANPNGCWPVWVNLPPNFDSFSNDSLDYSYTLTKPARTTMDLSETNEVGVNINCSDSDNWCMYADRYDHSGLHTGTWAGIDSDENLRPELQYMHIGAKIINFSKNAVIVYGSKPSVTALAVSPKIYNPRAGNQAISFTLNTFQGQVAPSVIVVIKNFSSYSVMKTITLNNVPSGVVNTEWNGLTSNGNSVSPDLHLITVTATDSIGQQATAQLFTTIRY